MKVIIIILSLLMFPVGAVAGNEDFIVYRNKEFRFIFHYPKDWKSVPTTHQGTKIKIVSENGLGAQDCLVNVQYVEAAKNAKTEEFVKLMSGKEVEKQVRKAMPDAAVIDSGLTYLSNMQAFYSVTKFTVRSLDLEAPMQMLQVQTFRDGYVYTVGCRATQNEYAEHLNQFKKIIAGFTIKNW